MIIELTEHSGSSERVPGGGPSGRTYRGGAVFTAALQNRWSFFAYYAQRADHPGLQGPYPHLKTDGTSAAVDIHGEASG